MPQRSTEVADLVADAKLMAAYAARVGKLANPEILASIGKVESSADVGGAYSDDVTALHMALNDLSKHLSPVTLSELGSRRTRLSRSVEYYLNRYYPPLLFLAKEVLMIFAAALIIFLVGYFTYIYKSESALYRNLLSIQSAGIPAKAETLYNDWLRLKYSPNIPISPSTVDSSAYYNELNELSVLGYSYTTAATRAHALTCQAKLAGPVSAVTRAIRVVAPQFAKGATADEFAESGCAPDQSAGAADIPNLAQKNVAPNYTEIDPQAAKPAKEAKQVKPAKPDDADVDVDYAHFLSSINFTAESGFPVQNINETIAVYVSQSEQILYVYGLWVLPAIYGLFGTMLFQFRSMMDERIHPSTRLEVRATLAIMAGISISWLSDSLGDKAVGSHPGGIGVFALAFIFGFSIDLFFVSLDKLAANVSKSFAPAS